MRAGRDESRNRKAGAEAKGRSFLLKMGWFVLFAVGAIAGIPSRAATTRAVFAIPAGEFEESILVFGHQANVEVAYGAVRGDTFKGIHTYAVSGQMEVRRALGLLLGNTDLVVEWESERSVVIRKSGAPAAPTSSVVGLKGRGAELNLTGPSAGAAGQSELKMPEVLVTGTLIHGVSDVTTPLTIVGKAELQYASYATVEDSLASLPLNTGAPQSEYGGGAGNFNRGAAVNLRGLGPQATLVLVDGQRQPMAGYYGDFVDVSNIPLSVIDRIEILPDGASALYGSDAVAGVVNIIIRDDLQGSETQARVGEGPGGGSERMFAQLFGHHSESGHWLLAYQYTDRALVNANDRAYAGNVDKRPQGGTDFRSYYSTPGNILDPMTLQPVFAIPPRQNGKGLSAAQLLPDTVNLENYFAQLSLLPEKRAHNLVFSGKAEINEHWELFGEAHYAQRQSNGRQVPTTMLLAVPRSNPFYFDTFGHSQNVLVSYSFLRELGGVGGDGTTRDYGAVAGIQANIAGVWHAALSAGHGQQDLHWTGTNLANPVALDTALADPDPETAFDPFGDGSDNNQATLEAIRTVERVQAISTIKTAQLTADGPLFAERAGDVKLAVGAESRWEGLDHSLEVDNYAFRRQRYGRRVDSLFSQLIIPFLGHGSSPLQSQQLELSLAGRYEHYNDSGSAFSPRVALLWAPIASAKFRSTWGRSFRAPKLADLYDTSANSIVPLSLPDPKSSSGQSLVLERQGNNAGLTDETATTWSSGVEIAPPRVPGLTAGLGYYSIDYKNRIAQPTPAVPSNILLQADEWAAAITRNPSASLIQSLCTSRDFRGSAQDCLSNPPAVIVDVRPQNLSVTRVRGLDVSLAQWLDTSLGRFHLDLLGNYVCKFLQQASSTASAINVVDTVGNPLRVRLQATADWYQHGPQLPGFSATAVFNYAGAYRDNISQPAARVDALKLLDLQARYQAPSAAAWWGDTSVSVRVTNVFNSDPPFVNTQFGYDLTNAQPYSRRVGVFIQKSWR